MAQSHKFTLRLLRSLSHELVVFVSASSAPAKYTVRKRTVLNLLISEHKFKKRLALRTEVVLSREDPASIPGTATVSLVRVFKDFKEEGLITTVKRGIFLEDCHGLLLVSDLWHNAVRQ